MANGRNLFVFVDLVHPDDNYDKLSKAVLTLGAVSKISSALWFVDSACSGIEVEARLRAICNPADSLMVVDATANTVSRHNLSPVSEEKLRSSWNPVQVLPPPPPAEAAADATTEFNSLVDEIERTAPVPAQIRSWVSRLFASDRPSSQSR